MYLPVPLPLYHKRELLQVESLLLQSYLAITVVRHVVTVQSSPPPSAFGERWSEAEAEPSGRLRPAGGGAPPVG